VFTVNRLGFVHCVAGDPSDVRGAQEPMPNQGARINMGRYGGTEQASKSPGASGILMLMR
jgi:hypothetical protein